MAHMIDTTVNTPHSWHACWPQWIGYLAALWSLCYAALGFYWTFDDKGFPFGIAHDPSGGRESLLREMTAASGAPLLVVLGLLSSLVALAMMRLWGQRLLRLPLFMFSCLLALTLLVLIPDRRVLMATAYAPVFLIGYPFHWPPVSFSKVVPWPVINQFILILGGLLWAMTALAYYRRTHHVCANCGRGAAEVQKDTRARMLRLGRWSVCVAVLIPVMYASTRLAWVLGIPLGISEQFLREGQDSGLWLAGASLAAVAIAGAILTLGLVQRWGEIFPRWMIGLSGKRVPSALAIVPAILVAIVITSAGLEYVRAFVIDYHMDPATWTILGPELFWPLWGVALGLATLAYYYRRRESCRYCGQGVE